jgi:hypothetical protein
MVEVTKRWKDRAKAEKEPRRMHSIRLGSQEVTGDRKGCRRSVEGSQDPDELLWLVWRCSRSWRKRKKPRRALVARLGLQK